MIFSIILILGTTQTAFAGFPLVEIDIDPGNDPNFINLSCPSPIPVALLGSDTFDVADVDLATLAFGPDGAAPTGSQLTDVNDDGLTDLLSFYQTVQTGIVFGDTEACLTGQTLDGTPFEGCDSIVTIRNVCAVGGEFIGIDSTMVLAAGAQYTAAWMIPVLVSAIGIGIVIARKF